MDFSLLVMMSMMTRLKRLEDKPGVPPAVSPLQSSMMAEFLSMFWCFVIFASSSQEVTTTKMYAYGFRLKQTCTQKNYDIQDPRL
jgi:hypothetical protein